MRDLRGHLKGWLRRQREAHFPDAETKAYRRWITNRLKQRLAQQHNPLQPGLLSIITAVWDGSPHTYLEQLAISIAAQNKTGACAWVIADNGCRRPELLELLDRLERQKWIRIIRAGSNRGIVRGLRLCLEAATARYILPVDADDLLYPDALAVVASHIYKHNFPPLLYSDEDKIIGLKSSQPYFKPDFDPVLLSNSAYVAHLGIVDRQKALALGAYTDAQVEGSVDWDLFLRFVSAGFQPVHIAEIVYQWRIHVGSTADDGATKSYIGSSQRAALQGFVDRHPLGSNFSVVESPLLPGGDHFRLLRSPLKIAGTQTIEFWQRIPGFPSLDGLRGVVEGISSESQLIFLIDENLAVDDASWSRDAAGIFELFPDTAAVGGRLRDSGGVIVEADQQLGFDGTSGSPNAGRKSTDPGYFGQMFKQRSASAVSSQMIAFDLVFLREALAMLPAGVSSYSLGMWLGAIARRQNRRVVYSPYLSAVTKDAWSRRLTTAERESFAKHYPQEVPDRRFYPAPFSLSRPYSIDFAEDNRVTADSRVLN